MQAWVMALRPRVSCPRFRRRLGCRTRLDKAPGSANGNHRQQDAEADSQRGMGWRRINGAGRAALYGASFWSGSHDRVTPVLSLKAETTDETPVDVYRFLQLTHFNPFAVCMGLVDAARAENDKAGVVFVDRGLPCRRVRSRVGRLWRRRLRGRCRCRAGGQGSNPFDAKARLWRCADAAMRARASSR